MGVLAIAVAAACAKEKGGCGEGAEEEKAVRADEEGKGEGATV